MCVYNRTGINENLRHWVRKSGDANIWKKMLVVIVADGRSKADEDTLKYLADLGVYSEDLMYSTLDTVKDVNVTMHMFEKTVQMAIDDGGARYTPSSGADNGSFLPVLLCLAFASCL